MLLRAIRSIDSSTTYPQLRTAYRWCELLLNRMNQTPDIHDRILGRLRQYTDERLSNLRKRSIPLVGNFPEDTPIDSPPTKQLQLTPEFGYYKLHGQGYEFIDYTYKHTEGYKIT